MTLALQLIEILQWAALVVVVLIASVIPEDELPVDDDEETHES